MSSVVNDIISKDNCFKVVFLMGLSENVLGNAFEKEYIESGYTNKFNSIPNATYLREIFRLRQLLFKHYNVCGKGTRIEVKARVGEYCESTVKYLIEEHNFDLYDVIEKMTLCGTINELSKRINLIVYQVLKDMGVAHKEIVGNIFKYPEFNKKNIVKYVSSIKSNEDYPYGIVMFNTARVDNYLAHMFRDDKNMYNTLYAIRGIKYSYENDKDINSIIKEGVSNTATPKVETSSKPDVTLVEYNTVKADNSELAIKKVEVHHFEEPKVEEHKSDESNAVEEPVRVAPLIYESNRRNGYEFKPFEQYVNKTSEKIKQTQMESLGFCSGDYTVEKLLSEAYKITYVYIDCDNINYFKFLALVHEMSKQSNQFVVKVFVDTKTSILWECLPTGCRNVKLEVISVDRIVNLKSMVDMVMTTEICKDVYKNGVDSIYIVSSDSDFLGLIRTVKIKDLSVIFNYDDTSKNYINYLVTNDDVKIADLALLDTNEVSEKFKRISISNLFLKHLSNLPICKWDKSACIDFIMYNLNGESISLVTYEEISDIVDELKSSVAISLDDGGYTLSAKGCTICTNSLALN